MRIRKAILLLTAVLFGATSIDFAHARGGHGGASGGGSGSGGHSGSKSGGHTGSKSGGHRGKHGGGHFHRGAVGLGVGYGVPYFAIPYYYPPYYPPNYFPGYPPDYQEPGAYGGPSQFLEPAYPQHSQAAETNDWFFCPGSNAYYPYVRQCPQGWQRVSPSPGGT